jgi:aryl-alcohol dehydrogenase-like predicted oxidoreductase
MTDLTSRTLGASDLVVSAVGLGCNNFGRPHAATESQKGTDRVIHAAIDHGITLLDTAEIYGYEFGRSETMMGRALEGRRDQVIIASKFGHADYDSPIEHLPGSRAYVREAIAGSLRRLRTDYIDLYQLHTPDPATPIGETLAALHELVDEGLVRAIGHSNFSPAQLIEADEVARAQGHPRFVSAQNEYNLLTREADAALLPEAAARGIGFLPWFPLSNGLFTGKFSRDGGPADSRIMRQRPHLIENAPWDRIDRYAVFCSDRGIGMLEATIGWLLSRPALTSVIAGATSEQQVVQNAAAASVWSPTALDLEELDDLFPTVAAPPATDPHSDDESDR